MLKTPAGRWCSRYYYPASSPRRTKQVENEVYPELLLFPQSRAQNGVPRRNINELVLQSIIIPDTKLPSILKIDFVMRLPTELSFKVLRYLDGKSLCHAAQVSHAWKAVADDDLLWYRMCSQHIDKKCTKCGWVSTSLTQGLPLMQKQKRRKTSDSSQV